MKLKRRKDNGVKVRITSKGAKYVDANELFQRPRVRQFLANMIELEKKLKVTHKASEANEST